MIRHIALLLGASLLPISAAQAETVTSPDGRIKVTLDADGEGIPYYEVARDGVPVITKSNLGFNFTDADPMRRNFEVVSFREEAHQSSWEQPWGERQWVQDFHNELAVTFRQRDTSAREITVRMRVFDDGMGFRIEFPESASQPVYRIADELTEFNIAGDGTAWSIPAGDWNRYEYLYQKTPVSALSTVHTPVTMVMDNGLHLSFHEAALVDYSGMWLKRMDGTRLRALLSPSPRGPKVIREGAFTTPWRTIQIASNPKGLFESNIILNLNEPNKLGDVSWFTPHKYIGIWWEMHLDAATWGIGAQDEAVTRVRRDRAQQEEAEHRQRHGARRSEPGLAEQGKEGFEHGGGLLPCLLRLHLRDAHLDLRIEEVGVRHLHFRRQMRAETGAEAAHFLRLFGEGGIGLQLGVEGGAFSVGHLAVEPADEIVVFRGWFHKRL